MTDGVALAPEIKDNLFWRMGAALLLLLCAACLLLAGTLELTWPQQAVVGLSVVLFALLANRSSSSHVVTLTLILLSCFSTFRYGYWRFATANRVFHGAGMQGVDWTGLDVFFVAILLLAETYAFLNLFLGYLQTLWPLRRQPVPLPEDVDLWPAVDLLIPTYNEPLSVVKYTALAALNIDWPADRLNVVVLDDGRREEFRSFCEQAGIGYRTRETNLHAKAGNINAALEDLHAPFVAIFDSDHVPTRSFLQITMGWFERDARLGVLQTPHHLYSPDPFERNLHQFRVIPNEGELFYGVVQDGNDFWNATFFCGSCAVLRRSALDEVGGIAVETVTEDAHTSLRMQMKGWNTAYINIPQAAGLATERLSGHVRQRIRWARGMVQVLRIENPLLARGLSAAQRLCYFHAMSHFLYALPRLIFLTAPLIYLVFGHVNVPGFWAAIVAYAVPHLLLASMTNSRIQGQHRYSFWNEIYETVLAPYIFLPTMLALLHPKLGQFSVTAKGGVVKRGFFDSRIATPFLLLTGMNLLGLVCALPRLFAVPHLHSAVPFMDLLLNVPANMHDSLHQGTVWMNVLWTLFNLTILSVATAVARESQQRRETVRVSMTVPASVVLPDGTLLRGVTTDVSSGGVMIRGEAPMAAKPQEAVHLIFPVLDGEATLPATVVAAEGNVLRAHFDHLTLQDEEALTMLLYSRADTWLGWGEAREPDRPLVSLWRILQLAAHGLSGTARDLFIPRGKRRALTNVAQGLLLAVLGGMLSGGRVCAMPFAAEADPQNAAASGGAGPGSPRSGSSTKLTRSGVNAGGQAALRDKPGTAAGQFRTSLTLRDADIAETIVLDAPQSHRSVHFAIPQTELVQKATMRLEYAFSPALVGSGGRLLVSLNGSPVTTLSADGQATGVSESGTGQADLPPAGSPSGAGSVLSTTFALPSELLVHGNDLRFELVGATGNHCGPGRGSGSAGAVWAKISASSAMELTGSVLPIANNLKVLPLPFLEEAQGSATASPIVFFGERSPKMLEAAGIVASWLGMLADRALQFPVSLDVLPPGNVIVLAADAAALPPTLNLGGTNGPTVALRSHPGDPYTKVLVLTGKGDEDVLAAARGLALEPQRLSGSTSRVGWQPAETVRQPDDAPRWLATGRISRLDEGAGPGMLAIEDEIPVSVSFHLPPDLYAGALQELPLRLTYRLEGVQPSPGSSLGLYLNGQFVASDPLQDGRRAVNESMTVPLAVSALRPGTNTLTGRLNVRSFSPGPCLESMPEGGHGLVLKEAFLDLRGVSHWARLPNLRLFANAGYPFTRFADLRETAVVLPEEPGAEMLELYLAVMGRFGAQTGYPAVKVTVTDAAGMDERKDLLVLSSVRDLSALGSLRKRFPAALDGGGLHPRDASAAARWRRLPLFNLWNDPVTEGADPLRIGGVPEATIEGFRWKRHSVVLIALRDPGEVKAFVPAILGAEQATGIAGNVSVLSSGHFVSYPLGGRAYYVGTLSWWGQVNWFFAQVPWLVLPLVALLCMACASVLRSVLRREARRRIQTPA